MRTIPLAPLPNQSASVVLGERNVDITLRTLRGSMFVDVICDNVPVIAGRICTDRTDLTARAAQLGIPDLQLWFADLRGTSDPQWEELGTRYVLLSTTPATTSTNPDITFAQIPAAPVEPMSLVYDGTAQFDGAQEFNGTLT